MKQNEKPVYDREVMNPETNAQEMIRQFRRAVEAEKCWPCGCLQITVKAVEEAFGTDPFPERLKEVMTEAKGRFRPLEYDCLGCKECYPAEAFTEFQRLGIRAPRNDPPSCGSNR
jgi:hypothetical protein